MIDQHKNGIDISELYFAFIDGSLDYNCITCPDNCCKGHGFGGMEVGAIGALIDNHPELLPWIQSREKGFIKLSTPPSGCIFLQQNGLCHIELTQGREAKPGVCLMFPFNLMTRIGSNLILMPNFLCRQLEPVLPPRPGSVAGSHTPILKDLYATGMVNRQVSETVTNSNEDINLILDREREFLLACSSALGIRRATSTIKSFSEDAAGLSNFNRRAFRLLGINLPQVNRENDHIDNLLHILLPVLRINYLILPPEGILRAMVLAEALIRTSFTGFAAQPTIVDLFSFIIHLRPILTIFGYGEEPFEPLIDWQSDRARPPIEGADQKMAFGAMIVLTRKGYGTLQALEEALSTVSKPIERVLFIRCLVALLKHMHPATKANEKIRPK